MSFQAEESGAPVERLSLRYLIRHAGALIGSNVVIAMLSLIQGLVVARWLGPAAFGLASLVLAYPSTLFGVFDPRSRDAALRFLGEFHGDRRKSEALAMCKLSYLIDLAVGAFVFLVVAASAGWAAETIVKSPGMTGLLLLYAASLAIRSLAGTSNAVLAALDRFSVIARLEVAIAGVQAVLSVGLVLAGYGVEGFIWAHTLAAFLKGILYVGLGHSASVQAWGSSWLTVGMRGIDRRLSEIVKFYALTDLSVLFGVIPKQLDLLLLGSFTNTAAVGLYRIAKTIAGVSGYVAGPLQIVAYARLSRLGGVIDRIRDDLGRHALRVGLPLAGLVVVGVLLLPYVVPLLLGESYVEAVLPAQLLVLGAGVWVAFYWLRPAFLTLDRLGFWSANSALVSLVSLAAFLIVIPRWGYVGLAAAQLLVAGVLGHTVASLYLLRVLEGSKAEADVHVA